MSADCANYAKFADRILVSSVSECNWKSSPAYMIHSKHCALTSYPSARKCEYKWNDELHQLGIFADQKLSAHIRVLKLFFTSLPACGYAACAGGSGTIFGKHKTCNKVRCSLSSWCCSLKTISTDADNVCVRRRTPKVVPDRVQRI